MKVSMYSYLWLIPLTLFFPLFQLLLYVVRGFALTQQIFIESLYFLPVGFISGLLLLYLLNKTKGEKKYGIFLCVGYLVGTIISIPGMLYGGLLFKPLTSILIFGVGIIVIATLLGYVTCKWTKKAEKLKE